MKRYVVFAFVGFLTIAIVSFIGIRNSRKSKESLQHYALELKEKVIYRAEKGDIRLGEITLEDIVYEHSNVRNIGHVVETPAGKLYLVKQGRCDFPIEKAVDGPTQIYVYGMNEEQKICIAIAITEEYDVAWVIEDR